MTYALFAAIVWQVIDFLRELTNLQTQKSSALTQLAAWVGGTVVIALGAQAAVTETIVLPGFTMPLGDFDIGSILLVGVGVASLASTGVDVKQAIDSNDSANKPPLLSP